MACNVQVLPHKVNLRVLKGTNLLEALRGAGLFIDAPCGGRGTCGKCTVIIREQQRLACDYFVEDDIAVTLPHDHEARILTTGWMPERAADPLRNGYLVAVDIGTTTVVCVLMDCAGQELAVRSMTNPQVPWGADVISRIQAAQRGQREALTEAVCHGIQRLIRECCAAAGITMDAVGVISIVGNSCMQQLFLGMDVNNLAGAPFDPAITRTEIAAARDYLPDCANAKLLILPDIAGFVGADTLGCILAAELHEAADTVLMVDIGTNGELVLAHNGTLTACSTAAGPALEGGNISCGMRAASGAVDRVWSGGCRVIEGGEARGVCGSGLIDTAAVMLNEGIMNFRGRILTPDHTYQITEGVILTQDDIRQLQMAKGAIAAGIQLLAEQRGLSLGQIDRVILAGAFGSFLDASNACRIGLLPQELENKITAAGNLALGGAKALAMDKKLLPLAQEILEKTVAVELSKLPEFSMAFAENMLFPNDK